MYGYSVPVCTHNTRSYMCAHTLTVVCVWMCMCVGVGVCVRVRVRVCFCFFCCVAGNIAFRRSVNFHHHHHHHHHHSLSRLLFMRV